MLIVTRWLWRERTFPARLARLSLVPLALAYEAAVAARAGVYRAGLLPRRRTALPTVAVGNLTVGGSGKTPVAQWIAQRYAARGRVPGIVLRGYGGDEAALHRERVPEAVVVERPDRLEGIVEAAHAGADVAVLDDAFQRLDLLVDLNVAVVSAESAGAVGWMVPAGPWREPWRALRRADLVVVTRKRAAPEDAARVVERVRRTAPGVPVAASELALARFRGLLSGAPIEAGRLHGRKVLAVAGVGDPDSFAVQLGRLGAVTRLAAFADHYPYRMGDVEALLQAGRSADYVVITAKDAVKLRPRWPQGEPEPLVAGLEIRWERNGAAVTAAMDAVVSGVGAGAT